MEIELDRAPAVIRADQEQQEKGDSDNNNQI